MILFRTDASADIGFGHLKRSAYLASVLKNQSDIFFCINNDKVAAKFLEERRAPYCSIKDATDLKKKPLRAIIFDLRQFAPADCELLQWAKAEKISTIQVTDLGLSQQPVDYTIDAGIEPLFPYESGKEVLSGPDYALLHHKFRHFNKLNRKYRKTIKHVFISLGGAVEYRRLRKLVDLLSRYGFHIKIAAGFYMKKFGPRTLKRIYPRLQFVGKTESLARAFFEADAAIITAGVAAAEAAAVGTPAFYLYYNNEQKFIASTYEKHGMGLEISNIDDVLDGKIIQLIRSLSLEQRIEMGQKGKQKVDGAGVLRIVRFLQSQGIIQAKT